MCSIFTKCSYANFIKVPVCMFAYYLCPDNDGWRSNSCVSRRNTSDSRTSMAPSWQNCRNENTGMVEYMSCNVLKFSTLTDKMNSQYILLILLCFLPWFYGDKCYICLTISAHGLWEWLMILALFAQLTDVNVLHWIVGLYCYGFLVNEGIGLILVIQTF